MSPTTVRTLLAIFIPFFVLNPGVSASRPLRPRNVKMLAVERGLLVTWEPPSELETKPVEHYVISYGKSMRALRFVRVDKDKRSQVLEDVEPGVLHFLKMTAENEDGLSKPVYRAETPGERRAPSPPVMVRARPSSDSVLVQSRPRHSSSDVKQPSEVRSYLLDLAQNDRRMDYTPRQVDRRGQASRNLASESVYVVSLQAQKALGQSSPVNRAAFTKIKPSDLEEMYEAKDITVRVVSPQSVLVTWVDPAVEKEKTDGSLRHYTLRYREKGESARWDYRETTQRRLMVDTLSADNMYEFSIRISEGERDSKWSVSVFQRTPESAPSGPPENFLVKPLRGKGTAVTATWDPPEESNGRIREYIVSYAPALKPFGAKTVTYRGSSASAVIEGLQPGERYIFKIRATNRRGQGPQSKAFSVAMPTSGTVASTSSHRSRGHDSRRTSHGFSRSPVPGLSKGARDVHLQSVEEPEEPTPRAPTTVSPTTRRSRPLSQTRSYHSILSSVRSTVRNAAGSDTSQRSGGGSRSPQVKDNDKETEYEEEEEAGEEADEEDRKELTTQNNVVLSKSGGDTSHNSRDPGNPENPTESSELPSGSLPKPPTGRRISPALRPRTASDSTSSKVRRPFSYPSISRPRSQDTDVPINSQESAAIRKDHTASSYPDGKDSYDRSEESKPPPKEAAPEPHSESAAQSAGGGGVSIPVSRHAGSGTVSGRRVPIRGKPNRVLNGQRKPGSSFALSQSTLPSAVGVQPQQGGPVSANHADGHKMAGAVIETQDERPIAPMTPRPLSPQDTGSDAHPSSRVNLGAGGHGATPSLQNRSPRPGFGSRVLPRQGARVPSNRESSLPSVGAQTPVYRQPASGPDVSDTQETREKARDPSTPFSSKNDATSGSLKPSLSNKAPVLMRPSNEHADSDNPVQNYPVSKDADSDDYVHHRSKDTYEKSDKIATTVPPQPATSTMVRAHRLDLSDNDSIERGSGPDKTRSLPVPSFPRRPVIGPNGRLRYPQLTNRQSGSRVSGRLLPSQHTRLGSSNPLAPSSGLPSSSSSSSSSSSASVPNYNPSAASHPYSRTRYPSRSGGKLPSGGSKPTYEQGKNGRPNLTATNGKPVSTSEGSAKPTGRRHITGPDGVKWIVDLDKGVLMNENGRVLQDSQGRPRRVILGEDGRTIFDDQGSPLVNNEGLALFGHGRDSRPVVNPKDKFFTLGGKQVVGLDRPTPKTTTTIATTTTTTTTTTTAPTTTPEPTTLPTTTEMTTEEATTEPFFLTCPPGTYSKMDNQGYPMLDDDGVFNCYPEEGSSEMEMDSMVTVTMAAGRADALAIEEEHFVIQTTLPPTTEAPTTELQDIVIRPPNSGPSSEYDAAGKKRFTAPYVNYIRKDPGAPCSLTEALEFLQMDIVENLFEKDRVASGRPPKNKPQNLTVVAMEGCHSFVILDWGWPLKDNMVSGFMVHSASYDDVLNNRWSSSSAAGTHLPMENLKPNSRYYFKVQAKNTFGLGPFSETFTYITESDDPLLIERPPGGEPIWIPFTFKYNPTQSVCKGSQFVKRTWYKKFVGVVLCNSLRYKIFMGDGLKDTFYSIGDSFGYGEDHCQFVDSYLAGRTGPHSLSSFLPTTQGFFRSYRQEPVRFGPIGRNTPNHFVGWYECGIPIPGKW